MRMNNKTAFFGQQGFSLIEIMIVVAILAIVTAFAYPAYMNKMQKGKRSDAYVALQAIAQLQETHYARNYSYATEIDALNYPTSSPEGAYHLSIDQTRPAFCSGDNSAPCTGFVAKAVPAEGKGQESDSPCQSLTLDNLGRKGAFDEDGQSSDRCW